MSKRYTRKDIKVGNYVCLDNQPWDPASYNRGEDRRTLKQIREQVFTKGKKKYHKVVGIRPLSYISGCDLKRQFYLKWVTDVCQNYNEVIKRRTNA